MFVAITILVQGIVQTVGVTSIMPFLAIAANPDSARQSTLGRWVLGHLPEMTDQTLLIAAGAISIIALVTTNTMAMITVYITQRYMRGLSHWLRVRLTWQLATREYAYFLQHSTAIMLKKVNGDARAVAGQVLQPLLSLAAGLVNTLFIAVALLWVDPYIAIFSTIALGGAYLFVFGLLTRYRAQFSSGMKEITRETNRKIQQLFGGIKPIKVQGVEQPFIKEFEHYSHREAILQSKQQILMLAPKQIIEPIAFGGLVLIVLIAAGRGESITSLIPTLGLMALAAYRLLPNIQTMYAAAMGIGTNAHVLEEVLEEFKGLPNSSLNSIRRKTAVVTPWHWQEKIQLDDISFKYPSSESFVFQDLNLTIKKNSSVAIVGTTGCGKSTLIDLILGLHRPTSGEILVDGTKLDATNIRAWQAGIGYVPQDIFLLDDTIRANIALGIKDSEIDEARLREVCEAAQILTFIEKDLAKSWRTQVGERGVRLSGGQRQRLGLARALYRRPELLILDEATSALDIATEAAVVDAVRAISGSLTMIIVAHRLSTIEWCDSVLNLQSVAAKTEAIRCV